MLLEKCCITILILLLIFLYLYSKKENFEDDQTTQSTLPISTQLRNEIGSLLNISPSRINNLDYEGNLLMNTLRIHFDIHDNNLDETLNNEPSKMEAKKIVDTLMLTDKFIVSINNRTVILRKMIPKTEKTKIEKSRFFDNQGLKEISRYADKKYISVPNDESLTKFYTLGFDKDYNLEPKL